ncbi:uracil-DNA glycosylase [Paenibacillus cellulosilyticus]|uniref:Uracil-DNA glycosylase n=2 Tax=Paenibacillus cellulosilyticus TaxID=375489 RepID=A0A2V2Z5J0_9BACL|nr:uracil-DNA glycosylase [Paenibacillus cellulosilyticus]PWW06110.1 uracil-DNA glycosylase [Paenibacillus cellulosilyticus]QKS43115.1 uracil-DNA glycosylase [Paenibacillus cellulosilyticus]
MIKQQDWNNKLKDELAQPYYRQLMQMLDEQYASETVYPTREQLFHALEYTPYEEVRVVILGQDPYHGPGQANGLSFSVPVGVRIPPSLRNIYKELQADIGCEVPDHGSLTAWAKQGVLLLNSVLSVQDGKPNSHKGLGWEQFTDAVIAALNERKAPVVFILWGSYAQQKASSINTDKHGVISSVHPSPLAARKGFFGSRPFTKTNEFLTSWGQQPIDWRIPSAAELSE